MSSNWSKGFTKETHPSVRKISETMKRRKIDNFCQWRKKMKRLGIIKSTYPPLKKNGDLAELIGVILGDGHIGKFPRTDVLMILSHGDALEFINRYAKLVEKIFDKKPTVSKRTNSNCTTITIYQKQISKRLGIPSGARKKKKIHVPRWILNNEDYILRYLRGLYEAEGCHCIHRPTSTYKFIFNNRNRSLLKNVHRLLIALGYRPNTSGYKVQISRKKEVEEIRKLLQFRKY
ncbi:hypothetical protein HYT54_03085 [Candidatus Woesearchaeota archaeon]|nr:hypothetical protein [Candidatus Woesearchaeota archaeon]